MHRCCWAAGRPCWLAVVGRYQVVNDAVVMAAAAAAAAAAD